MLHYETAERVVFLADHLPDRRQIVTAYYWPAMQVLVAVPGGQRLQLQYSDVADHGALCKCGGQLAADFLEAVQDQCDYEIRRQWTGLPGMHPVAQAMAASARDLVFFVPDAPPTVKHESEDDGRRCTLTLTVRHHLAMETIVAKLLPYQRRGKPGSLYVDHVPWSWVVVPPTAVAQHPPPGVADKRGELAWCRADASSFWWDGAAPSRTFVPRPTQEALAMATVSGVASGTDTRTRVQRLENVRYYRAGVDGTWVESMLPRQPRPPPRTPQQEMEARKKAKTKAREAAENEERAKKRPRGQTSVDGWLRLSTSSSSLSTLGGGEDAGQ